ncbi:MAG: YHS domain-containing (seleno)protein [Phycisphaerales bacterium]
MSSVLALAALLSGCAAPKGACVGTIGVHVETTPAKVLANTDSRGVAIEGYDPVAYFTLKKPVKGSEEFRSSYMGATYHFSTQAHKQMFDASPAKYAPQFGGYCAYAASINRISPIDPAYWEVVDGRLILQHNQKAWDAWHKAPADNLVKADKNWPSLVDHNGAPPRQLLNVDEKGVAIMGYDPVAYFTQGKPVQGSMEFARMYQGATYYFASKENKDLFESDPAKYVPEFGGFCGYAASINKVSPINPMYWQLVDGKLVLQHTQKAFDLFNKDVPSNYTRAQKNWPGLSHRRCGS